MVVRKKSQARVKLEWVREAVAARFKEQRLLANRTQLNVAEILGVEFQQVQKYENAKNRISVDVLWRVARYFGVPVSVFFDGLDELADLKAVKRGPRRFEFVHNREALHLLRVFNQIEDPMGRRLVVQQAERELARGGSGGEALASLGGGADGVVEERAVASE